MTKLGKLRPRCHRRPFGTGLRMLALAVLGVLSASHPAVPARPQVVRPHRVDRRTALQTLAAATVAVVAAPPARATDWRSDSGMLWIPKAQACTKKTSFQPLFITYLSRFLLNYDKSSATWWRNQLQDLPLSLERDKLSSIREEQFGQFSESVEVGLQKYQGKAGVRALFSFLRSRYGKSVQAKLQLALLFSIISPRNQPSALIARALGQADNGVLTETCVLEGGAGYAMGESPTVVVSAPNGGGAGAVCRAELAVTGQLLSINLLLGGDGYQLGEFYAVRVSPPSRSGGRPAQAVARVDGGRVVSLELTDRGRGYRARDVVTVTIDAPKNELGAPPGVAAKASSELETGVVRLVLEERGQGYARDQPLSIKIEPPLQPGGRGAVGKIEPLAYDPQSAPGLPSAGPYSDFYPSDSISCELLRLLPTTVRPTRRADGNFTFPLASGEALSDAKERNGGKTSGLDVNMESYLYASKTSSGLRQKLPFAAARDPTFGPLGTSPVNLEASLTPTDYLAFAASGAACTSLVRTALVPLDVAKTLMQSSPEAYPALRPAIGSLWAQGGLPSLYRSIDVTAVAGFLLGGFGFGVNEFLRRYFGELVGNGAAAQYSLQIAIAAALGSVIVTCLVTTPFEVLRLRAIEAATRAPTPVGGAGAGGALLDGASTPASTTASPAATAAAISIPTTSLSPQPRVPTSDDYDTSAVDALDGSTLADEEVVGGLERMYANSPPALPASAYNVVNGLGTLYAEGGVGTLYSGLAPLLLRELPFSITKYLVYDGATQTIASAFPLAQEGPLASALLSLTGGLLAGVIAAAVSTPADTLLTLSQTPPSVDVDTRAPNMLEIGKDLLATDPLSLFNGLLPRCVFFGALIAGQFLLYDNFKQIFKVGSSDIVFYLDVFASSDLSFWPRT